MLLSQQAREEAVERKIKTLSAAMRQLMPPKKMVSGLEVHLELAVGRKRKPAGVQMLWHGQVTVLQKFSTKMRNQTLPRNTLAAKMRRASQNGVLSRLMTTAMARVAEVIKMMEVGTKRAEREALRTRWIENGAGGTRGSS